jgi:hypothetical protein
MVVLGGAAERPAHAKKAPPPKAEAPEEPAGGTMAEEARIACLSGDWQRGVRVLAEIYVQSKEPTWLYNQGRCYQQGNQGTLAINRFRDFLRVAPESSPLVAKAKSHIAEIEADLKKAEPVAPAAPPPSTTTIVVPAPPAAAPTPPPSAPAAPPPVVEAPSRSTASRATIISLAAVGVLGLGAGIFSSVKVSSLESEATTLHASQLASQRDEASTYETLQWVGYGVGAAALVGAGVVYAVSGRSSAEGHTASRADRTGVSPLWGRGLAGISLGGTF